MNLSAALQLGMGDMFQQHPDHKQTVCVDFDGVLTDSSGPYTREHIGDALPEGIKLLHKLIDANYEVVILTARRETDLVANWLRSQGFPNMVVTSHKPPAAMYVDDRAARWSGKSGDAQRVLQMLTTEPAS